MIDLCDCDVKDKEQLALFRNRLSEWKKWLNGKSRHSIMSQIYNMLWNDCVFRTINEARRVHEEKSSDITGFNGPLIGLFDSGFAYVQTLAIRRLTDPNYHHPDKSIYSLVRLIDDISRNPQLFTRENYICYNGTLFDGPKLKNNMSWARWDARQKDFDILAGVSEKARDRKDKIQKSVIQKLTRKLKVCENIRTYVNKFVAHASTPESRTKLKKDQKVITLNKLDSCYQAIVNVSSFIGSVVLFKGPVGGVPTPQFDQLKHLNKPMVANEDIKHLDSFWLQRSAEVEDWDRIEWKEYINA